MKPFILHILLLPISIMYGKAIAIRNFVYDRFPGLSKNTGRPTISIGGIHAGGTGKTPLALLVGQYFHKKGYEVAFLSRGYKRKHKKNVISRPGEVDSWEIVGDEPALLHTALSGSWLGIGSNRHRNARVLSSLLSKKGIYILDDAFQHRQLFRNVDIVCLPLPSSHDDLLPKGTLREPLANLSRAHMVCLIGDPMDAAILADYQKNLSIRFTDIPIIILYQIPVGWVHFSSGEFVQQLPVKHPIILCGIARPERFLYLIKKMGISASAESIFKDHHIFKDKEIQPLFKKAEILGIITTEKDAFRLKSLELVNKPDIWYLKISLQFSDSRSEKLFYRIIDKSTNPPAGG